MKKSFLIAGILASIATIYLTVTLIGVLSVRADYSTMSTSSASSIATVQIRSTIGWTATIMDSGVDMQSYDGVGNRDIVIDCSQGIGIYSMNVQKAGEYGTITLSVVKDGSVLDTGTTSAAYGIVSLAGRCK